MGVKCERSSAGPIHTGRETQRAMRCKQMGTVDVNGGVHTACKQHQRKNIRICMHVASRVLCGLGRMVLAENLRTKTLFLWMWHQCKPAWAEAFVVSFVALKSHNLLQENCARCRLTSPLRFILPPPPTTALPLWRSAQKRFARFQCCLHSCLQIFSQNKMKLIFFFSAGRRGEKRGNRYLDEDAEFFPCPQCEKVYPTLQGMRNHLRGHVGEFCVLIGHRRGASYWLE